MEQRLLSKLAIRGGIFPAENAFADPLSPSSGVIITMSYFGTADRESQQATAHCGGIVKHL